MVYVAQKRCKKCNKIFNVYKQDLSTDFKDSLESLARNQEADNTVYCSDCKPIDRRRQLKIPLDVHERELKEVQIKLLNKLLLKQQEMYSIFRHQVVKVDDIEKIKAELEQSLI